MSLDDGRTPPAGSPAHAGLRIQLAEWIREMRIGTVSIRIQDGVAIQIERDESGWWSHASPSETRAAPSTLPSIASDAKRIQTKGET